LGLAIAGLATSAAFAQSGTPAGTAPPGPSSPATSESSPDAGVAVDVGELVKGLIKAVRKPPPKPAAPAETSAPATAAASADPVRPIDAAIVSPAFSTAAPVAVVPEPKPEPKAVLARPRPVETPFRPRVDPALPAASDSPVAPALAPAPSEPVRPIEVEPRSQVGPQAVAPAPTPAPPAAPARGERPTPAWPLMLLAAIAVAVAGGGRWLNRRRIWSRTRAALALSPRLELPGGGSSGAPLKFAGPPITIRTRMDMAPAHG
jgi:hypothetical protein